MRDIKEKLCYIPTTHGVEAAEEDEYELPDGTSVTLDSECRSKAAEVMGNHMAIQTANGLVEDLLCTMVLTSYKLRQEGTVACISTVISTVGSIMDSSARQWASTDYAAQRILCIDAYGSLQPPIYATVRNTMPAFDWLHDICFSHAAFPPPHAHTHTKLAATLQPPCRREGVCDESNGRGSRRDGYAERFHVRQGKVVFRSSFALKTPTCAVSGACDSLPSNNTHTQKKKHACVNTLYDECKNVVGFTP